MSPLGGPSGGLAAPTLSEAVCLLFAKAGRAGHVKTRLCPPLSHDEALIVHEAMLAAMVARMCAWRPAQAVLAVSPDDACARLSTHFGVAATPQGPGDLGARIIRACCATVGDSLTPVVLLGVDSPDLPLAIVTESIAALASHDAAMCPSADGGYCLLSMRGVQPALFEGIEWGSEHVARQTAERAAQARLRLAITAPWQDVDTVGDVDRLVARLYSCMSEPPLAQLLERLLSIAVLRDRSNEGKPMAPDAKPTVLIADDNPQILELLEAYLEPLDVEVRTAMDGEATLDSVAEAPPSLILLDVMMPRRSGFEVCRTLKEDEQTRHIPIVIVTALNEVGDVERGRECGADEIISKPVNKNELLGMVSRLLKSAETL